MPAVFALPMLRHECHADTETLANPLVSVQIFAVVSDRRFVLVLLLTVQKVLPNQRDTH